MELTKEERIKFRLKNLPLIVSAMISNEEYFNKISLRGNVNNDIMMRIIYEADIYVGSMWNKILKEEKEGKHGLRW